MNKRKADTNMSDGNYNSTANVSNLDFDLTADDLVQTSPDEPLEIPERMKNGRPGVVFISELPAGEVIKITRSKTDDDGGAWLFTLMSKAIRNRNGDLIFSEESAKKLQSTSISVFNRLQKAVLAKNPLKLEDDNTTPLAMTTSSDQPTESAMN